MRPAFLVMVATLAPIAACSSTPAPPVDTQAVRDYVEVGELEDVDHIRTYRRDSWSRLGDFFVIYTARTSDYLIEFRRICREPRDSQAIPPDHRYDENRLRAGQDTLRGCRIERIYPLTEAQASELRNLGQAPGRRN